MAQFWNSETEKQTQKTILAENLDYEFSYIDNSLSHDSLNTSLWRWNQGLISMANHMEMQQNLRNSQQLKLNLSAITWVKHACIERWQCFLSCMVNCPHPGKNVRTLALMRAATWLESLFLSWFIPSPWFHCFLLQVERQNERNHLQ